MPTTRGRIVFVALTLFIVYFLFIASPTSQSEREYKQRTQDGLTRRRSKLQGDLSDQEYTRQTNEKLRTILESHPYGPKGQHKNGEVPSAHHADEADAGIGRQRDRVQVGVGRQTPAAKAKDTGASGKELAREQLQEYLKKPVVIFSKSYCPHSRRAKELLTQVYTITPAPTIVELDLLTERVADEHEDTGDEGHDHPHSISMGSAIQGLLFEITGRSTVPNIVVGMKSIGGNDLIWDLHDKGDLVGTIERLGGKRVTVERNPDHLHEEDS